MLADGLEHLSRSLVMCRVPMVVWKCYAAVGFFPVFKELIAAHVEETLVLHESSVFAVNYGYAKLPADGGEFHGIPVQAPVGMIAFDKEF
jgi:hypothetical protein